jgi:lysophospholipase L1-like esterase
LTEYKVYIAIGDSTTEGLFDPDGQGGNRGWADRLAEHIARQNPGLLYANLAIRGRLTRQIRDEQLEPALAMSPDLVSVVSGMNDILRPSVDLPQVAADIDAMFSACRSAGAEVITCTFGDPVPINPWARLLRKRMHALNSAIRASAERHGVVLVDFASVPVVSDPRFWCEDRLHANTEGHTRIAAAMAEALGIALDGSRWDEPLPLMARRARREAVAAEVAWARQHLFPWVGRRLRGASSGDGVFAKRPDLLPVVLEPGHGVGAEE